MSLILENILKGANLDSHKYKATLTKTNRGDKYGLPHMCKYCESKDTSIPQSPKVLIEIGKPLIRLTEINRVENSERMFFKSWLFHNEECLVAWLDENNPEWIL